jgi:ABC-type multidrug transport system ATPase subunit
LVLSPQGGLYGGFLANGEDVTDINIENFPPPGVSITIMIVQTLLFLYFTIYIDDRSIAVLSQVLTERVVDESVLDEDVVAERKRVLQAKTKDTEVGSNGNSLALSPVVIERLRKVYPAVKTGGENVTAVEDIVLALSQGEIFGLLGANGAGKTTLLSMLTRLMMPTSGNAYVCDHSILASFRKVATNLGVVTQNNSLWDRLSVESHLYLFARLRGVPENMVKQVVEDCLLELELLPHRHKLSMTLSGGMKRKLCVAIALIGDPKVVLLDEPSAGLDPVSRRNLWSVILRTMRHRTVILTTHSMEEAEVLTTRIGIMVKGQLHALGTKQHLKNKFGTGFELVIKLATLNSVPSVASAATSTHSIYHPSDIIVTEDSHEGKDDTASLANNAMNQYHSHLFQEEVKRVTKFLQNLFPSTILINENGGLITFRLTTSEVSMSTLFLEMEKNKDVLKIEDYSIAQPTLEQVSLFFVL